MQPIHRSICVFQGECGVVQRDQGGRIPLGNHLHKKLSRAKVDGPKHPLRGNWSRLSIARLTPGHDRLVDGHSVPRSSKLQRMIYQILRTHFAKKVAPVRHCCFVYTDLNKSVRVLIVSIVQ